MIGSTVAPVEAAEPLERVHHLGLLLLELALVRQHLPRRARMRRPRLDPVGRRLEQLGHARLAIAPLALEDTRAYAVTRDRALHEQDIAAGARDAAAAVGERLDHELELVADRRAGACLGLCHATYAGKP